MSLLRRRAMMVQAASPTPPPTLIYELEEPTSTASYDTGVKLFDTPKSFTILCEASFANRGWSNVSNTNSIFGLSQGVTFRVGAFNGNDYRNGVLNASEKRYTALVANATGDTDMKKCTSMFSRMSTTAAQTHRMAVRYDHTARKVEAFTDSVSAPSTRWFNVDSAISSTGNIKFWLGTTGTMNSFQIYNGLLSDADINTFLSGN